MSTNEPEHVNYPHFPGYLYDCPACESRCHCTPGHAECVFDGDHEVSTDADTTTDTQVTDFACPPYDMRADLDYAAACDTANAAYLVEAERISHLKGGNAARMRELDKAREARDLAYGVAWRRYVNADEEE